MSGTLSINVLSIVSNSAYILSDGYNGINLTASGSVTNITLTMPSNPIEFSSLFILSDIAITGLTINPNTDQSFLVPPPPSMVVGSVISYLFRNRVWRPL